MKIPKNYNHKETEDKIYAKWEKERLFKPETSIEKGKASHDSPYFSMVLPPPNVTGILHMGHALGITIEDILARFHRMKGYKTLWIPGTDHAAIATQSKVESILQKEEGKNRHQLGKKKFLEKVNSFASESHDTIVKQVRKMGASVDWEREAYTLDEKRNRAVKTAFKRLHDMGLIYKGMRIVNWDPRGQTTVSDDEVNYEEAKGKLYTFYYDKDFPIPIATTRPETKLGDTAVAVNPGDKRYKEYIGKEYKVNFAGESLSIKIVGDEEIDPEFGTGAVGVTPAHSFTDWEIAERHGVSIKQIINEKGEISIQDSEFNGKEISKAREEIVEKLKEKDLLVKEEFITQNIAKAERTDGTIEPLPKMQWFINVNKKFVFPHSSLPFIKKGEKITLKKLMELSVKEGCISLVPKKFEKTYFHWINNLRDWCISRQIWFGHHIPAYYCKKEGRKIHQNDAKNNFYISIEAPEKCPFCGECEMVQDSDTLDTWFSSGLWTFSTLGWPEESKELMNYHPTTVLETGHDILFFWVARMILMTTSLIGEIPFRYVYLHGIVRDERGRKMSKSIGNIMDPIEVSDIYGTDALRMSLVIGSAPGNDVKISEDKIKAQKHFANKIWNATRFVVSVMPEEKKELDKIIAGETILLDNEKKHQEDLKKHIKEVTRHMENFRIYLAAEKLYQYFWHNFADIIIEESKESIYKGREEERMSALQNLYLHLTKQLKLLHPFMPYVTEEIWSMIPRSKESENYIMIEDWPKN